MFTEPTMPAAGCAQFTVSAVVVGPEGGRLVAVGRMVGGAAAARLAAALDQQLAAGRCYARLDLTRVPMLDRAGFDALIEGHHRFLVAGGTLILTGVGPRIARLLELTGLDRTLCPNRAARCRGQAAGVDRPFGAAPQPACTTTPEPSPVPATNRSDYDQIC